MRDGEGRRVERLYPHHASDMTAANTAKAPMQEPITVPIGIWLLPDEVAAALGVAAGVVVAAAEDEGDVVRVTVPPPTINGGAVASVSPLAVPEVIKKLAEAPALEPVAVAAPEIPAMLGS